MNAGSHVGGRIFLDGAYKSLLRAMFPEALGVKVSEIFLPAMPAVETSEDPLVLYCLVGEPTPIPTAFIEVNPRSYADSVRTRHQADMQVRERFKKVIDYLHRHIPERMHPPHIFAISALGLRVRFYVATVGKSDEPIVIKPPAGEYRNNPYGFDRKAYDDWKLSIVDTLCVNTLKRIRSDVLQFNRPIRATWRKLEKFMKENPAVLERILEGISAGLGSLDLMVMLENLIPSEVGLFPGTSRSASPLTQSALGDGTASQRDALVQPVIEDEDEEPQEEVFAGENLAESDFERLGLPIPAEGYAEGEHVDLFTLLGMLPQEADDHDDSDVEGDSV